MWQLATAFGEIALRRRGPESLPDSGFLLAAIISIYLIVSSLHLWVDGQFSQGYVLLLAFDTVLALAFFFAVLAFFKLERRFRQTICAILGVDVVINLVYLPCALLGLGFGLELLDFPFAWLQLALIVWSIAIAAWVLARSLSQPLIVGFMFEILYLFVSYSLLSFLIVEPELAAPPP